MPVPMEYTDNVYISLVDSRHQRSRSSLFIFQLTYVSRNTIYFGIGCYVRRLDDLTSFIMLQFVDAKRWKWVCSLYIIYKTCVLFDIRDIIHAIVRKILSQEYGVIKQEKFRMQMLELYESIQSSGSISLVSLVEVINCYFSTLCYCNYRFVKTDHYIS